MTSNHDQDAFEFRFEGALDEMHKRTHRGNSPSAKAWATIRAGLPGADQRAETADPRAFGPDPAPVSRKTQRMRKESDMDTALNPGMAAPPPRANRGLFAWAAIALVGVLVASTFFLNGQTPPGDDGNDLAWAPGLGTAESSPAVQVDDSVCSVDPLTTAEALETVLNPNQGYRRLGNNQAANSDSLWEPTPHAGPEYWTSTDFPAVDDAERADELEAMGNEYVSCLQYGSAFQVWSFLDPIILQQYILQEFPVLRAEADLRAYIESVGPQPFVDSGDNDMTSLIRFNQNNELHVSDEEDALQFSEESERSMAPHGFGFIRFNGSGFSSLEFGMYLTEVSPNVWVVNYIAPLEVDE